MCHKHQGTVNKVPRGLENIKLTFSISQLEFKKSIQQNATVKCVLCIIYNYCKVQYSKIHFVLGWWLMAVIVGPRDAARTRPSPSSTTMEDVLDSLLGLPPTSRSPSPSSPSLPVPSQPKQRRSCGDLHQGRMTL